MALTLDKTSKTQNTYTFKQDIANYTANTNDGLVQMAVNADDGEFPGFSVNLPMEQLAGFIAFAQAVLKAETP